MDMTLHKKTHRLLLLVFFMHLAMCPHTREANARSFHYNAITSRIASLEHRSKEIPDHLSFTAEAAFPNLETVSREPEYTTRSMYEVNQKTPSIPVYPVKLRL